MADEVQLNCDLIQFGVPTANGRIYSKEVLEKAVEAVQEKIKAGRMLGQLGNPVGGRTNMAMVSHKVVGLGITDDGLVGLLRPLDTPEGRKLSEMLKRDECQISPRGMASINEDGLVGFDYQITSVDVVLRDR